MKLDLGFWEKAEVEKAEEIMIPSYPGGTNSAEGMDVLEMPGIDITGKPLSLNWIRRVSAIPSLMLVLT